MATRTPGPIEELARLQDAVRRQPASVEAWDRLISVLLRLGRPDDALAACRDGLQLNGECLALRVQSATCRLACGDPGGAGAIACDLLARDDLDVVALSALGRVLSACERHPDALVAYERAAKQRPSDMRVAFNLATSLRNNGEFERAEAVYDRIVEKTPGDWEAYRNRSDLRPQTPERNHIEALQAALMQAGNDPLARSMLHGALGKECEDLGRDDEAFAHFEQSASEQRRTFAYSVRTDVERMGEIARTHPRQDRAAGYPNPNPIFILGLPRTGSTLLDRILSSLPDVQSAGELQNFGIQTFRLAQPHVAGPDGSRRSVIEASARIDPATLGAAYIDSVRLLVDVDRPFTDKMPNNFLYIGLIAAALPHAPIIHVTRHPMDTCFAIFKTPFKQAYPYAYNLAELGDYYIAYRRLVDHWRASMPGRIIDVAYEDIVLDGDATIRRLCETTGLPFDPSCLATGRNRAPVSTASAAQVRRGIYTSSLGRWRRHADELAPLAQRLQRAGIDL